MSDPMSQWLETSTTRTSEVTLYSDQVGVEKLMSLYAQADALEKSPVGTQRVIGEKSKMADIERQIERVEAEVAESRSVWTLRALTRNEIKACNDLHPDPEPKKNARDMTQEELAEYRRGARDAGEMRTLELIAKAVVKVEFASATVDAVPVSTLKTMLDAEYGDFRINLLNQARKDAGDSEKGMPRPK